jgi:hypothetical protein
MFILFFANTVFALPICQCKLTCNGVNGGTAVLYPLVGDKADASGPWASNQDCEEVCKYDINQAVLNNLLKPCALCAPNSQLQAYSNHPATPSNLNVVFLLGSGGQVTPSATSCKCPSGWLANATNIDGGATGAGNYACKKSAAPCLISVTPEPPTGTAISGGAGKPDWGFTWGNGIYAWGTAANGGQAACTTAPCKFSWIGLPTTYSPICTGPNC